MTFKSTLAASAAALALLGGFAVAQETTGSIRGTVTDEAGAPLAGATVVIADEGTGRTRTLTTNADGRFAASNLSVSGEYTVTARAAGYDSERADDIRLSLGDTTELSFGLAAFSTDEIVVVASGQVLGAGLAAGPSSAFGLEILENAPAINRDIKDIVRIDPRVYLDEGFNDSIQCIGANPRFNSLTVDGVRLNDNFGLNSNGYPTERIPFSFDAIEQVAVELAPFDVEYGSFTACNINAVTKQGSNEFSGSVFVDYTNNNLRGEEADGRKFDNGEYDEYRYGINVGGPIIKDRLFFFAAYEKQTAANLFGGNTPEGTSITEEQFQQIVDIAQSVYGYEVGGLPTSLDTEDEKLLVKLDLNIADNHRASFTYNYNDGFNNSPSDSGSTQLSEFKHFFERGAKLQSYVGAVYSDWTPNLSTEFRVSYIDLQNRQIPLNGLEIGEVQIRVPRIAGGTTTVFLGADDSRHANELSYELLTYIGKADYTIGNHTLTFGAEREEFDVFNLFIQEVQGEWLFNSIADFQAGNFADFRYENAAGSNNQDDGAAVFGYQINSLYVQDEWQATNRLNLIAGLRYDFYTSDDKPAFNQTFHNRYGIRNDDNLEGKSVVQPRFAFTYEVDGDLTFRGGIGRFAGGNPNVWISNNYSNNGVTLFECRERNGSNASRDCLPGIATANVFTGYTYGGGSGSPFFDVPDQAIAAVAAANGGGPVNALDPEFEIPSEWKFNLGLSYDFDGAYAWMGDGYHLEADVIYTLSQDAATIQNLEQTLAGPARTSFDGRPVFTVGPFNDFLLTNSEDEGYALSLSAALSKSYDNGLDWTFAYAYTEAEDANPMTSSVAFSNFVNVAASDANNLTTATSDYEIPHRFTAAISYERDFVKDYTTRFSLFGQSSKGAPFSYTYGNNPFEGGLNNPRQLFYVPTGVSDPNVLYNSDATRDALLAFIAEDDELSQYRGRIAPRNAFNDDWWTKFDLRISQDLPGAFEGHRSQAFVVIENVSNLLNSDWGVLKEHSFPGTAGLVDVSVNSAGQYVYSNFRSDADQGSIIVGPSLWEVRFGLKYDF